MMTSLRSCRSCSSTSRRGWAAGRASAARWRRWRRRLLWSCESACWMPPSSCCITLSRSVALLVSFLRTQLRNAKPVLADRKLSGALPWQGSVGVAIVHVPPHALPAAHVLLSSAGAAFAFLIVLMHSSSMNGVRHVERAPDWSWASDREMTHRPAATSAKRLGPPHDVGCKQTVT